MFRVTYGIRGGAMRPLCRIAPDKAQNSHLCYTPVP